MITDRRLGRRKFLWGAGSLGALAVLSTACGTAATPTAVPPAATTLPATVASNVAGSTPISTPAPAASVSTGAQATSAPAQSGGTVLLNGAGSTFDNPLFSKAFSEYSKANKNIQINYQAVGSGAGIQQLTQGTVDFGASDAPMTDQQIAAAGGDILHIPVTLGAVSVGYNLSGIADGLKLDGPTLANIFLGTITSWNDAAITKLNPGMNLPNTPIAVVHRSDGSGTTDIFTSYLSSVSPNWKSKVGLGTAVSWPVGIGGKGSDGVSGQVKQTPGGIGYFELAYAKQNSITSAAMDNGTGTFVLPSSDGATACATSAGTLPADLRVRIAGCTGNGVYPISGFSWIVVHQKQTDPVKGPALANLLAWLVTTGQTFATDLFYAPLAPSVVKLDQAKIQSLTYQGKPILPAA